MRVFKTTYKDRNGQTQESAKWYVEFRDHLEVIRRLPAFTDKKLSEELGRKVERLVVFRTLKQPPDRALSKWIENLPNNLRQGLNKIGLLDNQRLAASKTLSDHLTDFKAALSSHAITAYHVNQKATRLKRIFDGCGFTYWSDISAARIENFLADLRARKTQETYTANISAGG